MDPEFLTVEEAIFELGIRGKAPARNPERQRQRLREVLRENPPISRVPLCSRPELDTVFQKLTLIEAEFIDRTASAKLKSRLTYLQIRLARYCSQQLDPELRRYLNRVMARAVQLDADLDELILNPPEASFSSSSPEDRDRGRQTEQAGTSNIDGRNPEGADRVISAMSENLTDAPASESAERERPPSDLRVNNNPEVDPNRDLINLESNLGEGVMETNNVSRDSLNPFLTNDDPSLLDAPNPPVLEFDQRLSCAKAGILAVTQRYKFAGSRDRLSRR